MKNLDQQAQHSSLLHPLFQRKVWQFICQVTVISGICLVPIHLSANDPVDVLDTDGDGIANSVDLDDDNDGIPDELENTIVEMTATTTVSGSPSVNADSDEHEAAVDVDSDNDRVSDTIEFWGTSANFDSNNDGHVDDFIDSNLNGWHDPFETLPLIPTDTDNDGWPDYLDRDSDNDGLWDYREAFAENYESNFPRSSNESTLDGFSGVQILLTDTDQDGIPDMLDLDSDNDLVPDVIEVHISIDANYNGIPNQREIDSDGDGIGDLDELNGTTEDTDNDGIVDTFDADYLGHDDRFGDGVSDLYVNVIRDNLMSTNIEGGRWESDADRDRISDIAEWGADPSNPRDTDSDGTPDYLDRDSDNDGIDDRAETEGDSVSCHRTCTNVATAYPRDSDGDYIPNHVDPDSDNDSILDSIEAGVYGSNEDSWDYRNPNILQTSFIDSDKDGILDLYESRGDSDGDGVPDYLDRDSDNDGLLDAEERLDSRTDGFPDTDGDGITDQLDLDSDQDGLSDAFETLGLDADGDGRIDGFRDADGDGANDATSGAVDPNYEGRDNQKAYLGPPYHKDLDSDNDGYTDVFESFGPGFDAENNGYIDVLLVSGEFNQFRDDDGDGIYNHLDLDSDGDGVSDLASSGAVDINDDGVVDFWTDTDGDGLSDWVDADMGPRADHDNDGIANLADSSCYSEVTDEWVSNYDQDANGIIDGYARTVILHTVIDVGYGQSFGDYREMETHTFRTEMGYVHMFQSAHHVGKFDQFDANRNCIPDTEEVPVANETMAELESIGESEVLVESEVLTESDSEPPETVPPVLAAARASGSGGGCSIASTTSSSGTDQRSAIDPTLWLLLIFSGMSLLRRAARSCDQTA